ncbi:DUF6881 domain-containing protein [Streptomyces sp. NPDC005047]
MSENTGNTDKTDCAEIIEVSAYTEQGTRYPLNHYAIAVHLGINEYTETNLPENLRRARAFLGLYERMGKTILLHPGGSPIKAEEIDENFIRAHEGQRSELGYRSPEDFDEHLKNLESSLTGVRRVSYRRVRFTGPLRLDRPHTVVQEINDQYRSESRRVELYADGRLLWREDGFHGEGPAEEEHTETEDVPGLSILNDRTGLRAEEATAEEFESLWERATGESCGWVAGLRDRGLAGLSGAESLYCTNDHGDGTAFCAEHEETARRMFPALFEGA